MRLTANVHIEDGAFWADVSELPGCFASGDTLDELFTSLREGIELCLAKGGSSTSPIALEARGLKADPMYANEARELAAQFEDLRSDPQ